MLQGEQRTTYLSGQISVAEVQLEDMACQVAALDSFPLAAVMLIFWLPGRQEAPGVAGDALLERQEGVPLLGRTGGARVDAGEGIGSSCYDDYEEQEIRGGHAES